MATTKTLTPTNQAITLTAFTEKPDNRTNVTNDDKLADAVNALNSNLTELRTAFAGSSIKDDLTSSYGDINSAYAITIGSLCVVTMYFTPNATIPALTEFVSGLPRPIGTWNYPVTFLAHAVTNVAGSYRVAVRDSNSTGVLQALDQISGAAIRFTFVYFKN